MSSAWVLVILGLSFVACNHREHEVLFPAKWNYDRNSLEGPSKWAQLFPQCGAVGTQSPIDIDVTKAKLKNLPEDITWDYKPSPFFFNRTDNVGQYQRTTSVPDIHSIKLIEDGLVTNHVLDAVRVHSPAEHTIDGKVFPVEFQFIHRSVLSEKIIIISVLATLGRENTDYSLIAAASPNSNVNFDTILPHDRSYFEYIGSLSAPPCDGTIRRFVLENTIELSKSQVGPYSGIRGWYDVNHQSNRPTLPYASIVQYHSQSKASLPGMSSCTAGSSFNMNTDEWYGFPIQSTNSTWVGPKGRHLESYQSDMYPFRIEDNVPSTSQFFSAPLVFRGKQSHSYDGALSFQIKSCAPNPDFNYPEGDVVIKGHRWELVTSLPFAPDNTWWTQYVIRLNEGPWINITSYQSGSCLNEVDQDRVLSDTCTYLDSAGTFAKIMIRNSVTVDVQRYSDSNCSTFISTATMTNGVCDNNLKVWWDRKQVPQPGWRIRKEGTHVAGVRASKENITMVLNYVKCVNIRSRFSHVHHWSQLDNAMICDGVMPLRQCPGFRADPFQQCSGHGTCVKTKCQCNHGWDGDDCAKKVKCDTNRFELPDNKRKWKPHDENIVNPDVLSRYHR